VSTLPLPDQHLVSIVKFGVLGPVTLWRDGLEVMAGQPKQLAVLGLLAAAAVTVIDLALWRYHRGTGAR